LEKQSRKVKSVSDVWYTKGFYVLVFKPIWIKARNVGDRTSTRDKVFL